MDPTQHLAKRIGAQSDQFESLPANQSCFSLRKLSRTDQRESLLARADLVLSDSHLFWQPLRRFCLLF